MNDTNRNRRQDVDAVDAQSAVGSSVYSSDNSIVSKGKEKRRKHRFSRHNILSILSFCRGPRHGIAARLLVSIVLFSSVVTLVVTAIQLYTDYKRDIQVITTRLNEIETSYLNSIQASFWNMDVEQMKLQLDGILQFPDVKYVELTETDPGISQPLNLFLGEKVSASRKKLARSYPVLYVHEGNEPIVLGELYIETSLDEIYDRLLDRAVVIFFSQGVKTFLVSLFILYIFHTLVNRHLEHMSRQLARLDLAAPSATLRLHRKKNKRPDELDNVVEAYNAISESLRRAYDDLKSTNMALQEDIIAREEAEREISRLNESLEHRVFQRTSELEAANKELNAFCYSVSHDLRAPLRRIEGFRKILSDAYEPVFDSKGLHYLSRIRAGTQEMSDMIDSFLKLSRATTTTLITEDINITDVALKACNKLREKEPQRFVELNIETDLHVEGDRRLIEILITNLIDNAWKYTSQEPKPKIEFGVEPQAWNNVYFVRDNGVGFDKKLAEHLFKPFTRLHKQNEFEGIGIGLATVQRIVARHGGRVWFEALPNKGATFYFTLWEGDKE